jgi:hypothetical protein
MDLSKFLNSTLIAAPSQRKIQHIFNIITRKKASQSADLNAYLNQIIFTNLPSPALDEYFTELFWKQLQEPAGNYMLHCALNFGVQELAVRSRVSPQTEQFLQIGCFNDRDFAAAIINGMGHTRAYFCPHNLETDFKNIQLNIEELVGDYPKDSITNFQLIQEDYWTFLSKQNSPSLGFLALLNLNNLELYHKILPELSKLLTFQGTCLIVDLFDVVEELEKIVTSLEYNREVLITTNTSLIDRQEKLGWLLINCHKNNSSIRSIK